MNRKHRVAVLRGGMSCEREISLKTGALVSAGIDRAQYEVVDVRITERGAWLFGEDARELPLSAALERLAGGAGSGGVDVAFVALHGTFGEDGAVQGLLEWAGIPYTGSGILGSALAMDKERSREILRVHGIAVPRSIPFDGAEWRSSSGRLAGRIASELGPYPVVVKPTGQGSSKGVHIVRAPEGLGAAVSDALGYGDRLLAEGYLRGDEATCAVLDRVEGGEPQALPPTQIIPKTAEFFDYAAKYTPGASEEITPPRFPAETIRAIQDAAVRTHLALGLYGMSRTDFIVAGGTPYALEANTIPGMTETSLLPQAARSVGIEFPALLDRILKLALRRGIAPRPV